MQFLSTAAAAVAAALLPDPFYQAITVDHAGDDARRRSVLCAYMQYALAEARQIGLLTLAPDPALGAAAWLIPRNMASDSTATAAKHEFLQATLRPLGYDRYRQIVGFMGPRCSGAVPAGAWYLSIVGVSPAAQGRSVGAGLLAPGLAAADSAGVACYLESFSARNPAFYGRLGFQTIATHHEPTTDSAYAIMLRAPR